ncbi:C6 finger domain [Colletotrichum musicola]|uniref:C6 finger domain n=1 Tax=Colletotrichum musicola TaxID=2175873 RepID=A0A8H6NMD4_9PEZI|nr:C6 finger domain [Colletotrichum musicola]
MDPNMELLNVGVVQGAPPIGILLCSICSKPFNQGGHISYCRRTQNRPKVRPKPCRGCKAAKSKCSLQQRCVRCVRKGLACVYPEAAVDPTIALTTSPVLYSATLPQPSNSEVPSQSIDEEQFWNTTYEGLETLDALLFPSTTSFPAETGPLATTRSNNHVAGFALPRTIGQLATAGIRNDSAISTPTQLQFPLGSLRRPNPASESCAKIIRQTLSAFPQMMLRRSTFPPFIHPQRDKSHLPAPLASCMAISGLFASRNDDTRPILWKAVREEQERSVHMTTTYSRSELFAAMQAQIIYITMRLVDGFQADVYSREYNAKMLLAYKLLLTSSRVLCIWCLFAQVSSIDVGIPCTILDDWAQVPLPCHKAQWAATTPEDWKEETDAIRNLQNQGSGPATFGDLCDLYRGTPGKANSDRLSVWNAGADNIGMLLNLVATMA